MFKYIPIWNKENKLKLEKMRKIFDKMIGDKVDPIVIEALIDFTLVGLIFVGISIMVVASCLK